MGSIAVVGLAKPYGHYSAPETDYTQIFGALGGGHGGQSLTPGFIVINGAGEAVGYSTQLRKQWTPQVVADHVKSGGTWIDYCGWPMFYQGYADGTSPKIGRAGWTSFANNAGYGWLKDMNWNSSGLVASFGFNVYGYIRGFTLTQSLDGVAYPVNSAYTFRGYTAMVALVHPSGGHYFWGCYTPEEEILASVGPAAGDYRRGVPVSAYTTFIQSVLRGRFGGYSYKKYYLNTQKVPTPVSTSSSPTSTSSQSTSTSPNPSPSTSRKKTSTAGCPSGYTMVNGICQKSTGVSSTAAPGWVKPALGAGLLLLGGGTLYYVGNQEGWWGSHGNQSDAGH